MNLTYLRLEAVRLIRNKRAVIFSTLMPALLVVIIGGVSVGNDPDAKKYVMVSMALFGAMTAAMFAGGTIAIERGLGWNRTLRLTPLSPAAYVLNKVLLSLVMGIPPVVVTFAIGALGLHVRLTAAEWVLCFVGAWLSSLPFAALGVVVGYLAKPDSVQQVSALLNLTLAAFGGLWVPVDLMPHIMQVIAKFTPSYWTGQVARSPLDGGHIDTQAIVVLLGWTVVLGVIALRRFRVDTARA
ncbi:ABC transporter permease [Dactylosporangium matsuzakiense]|uniref:ABC transporter n=1 Tax=Dactylosporangium matsuzakiense TaxID=53360 RepID=A0A9W6KRV1_9ACTN|nr:ABC transporter permease [Dactylosporangium matsuzakiense]UWZ41787.1 ABC transporter permease [Dactylosporangium matsuzakiense]GLL06962.1 ABC transporter [Dactylosporangium matsuzakiense]